MPIVSSPPGGTAYVYSVLAEVINASWDLALTKQTQYEAKIATATSGFLDTVGSPHVTAGTASVPAIAEPAVFIPSTVETADIFDSFDTKYLELVTLLSDKFVTFRASYFPDEQNAYVAAEDWLQAAFANDAGLPTAVHDQLLTDARDSILAEAAKATDEVMAVFAARRFPLPPGASASAVLQIQGNAQAQMAEAARKITIMSVEQFRFLVKSALELRQGAMAAAVEYIKALASGPDMASRVIGIGYDAQSKLISAASAFYNARSQAAEVITKAGQYNVSTDLEAKVKNQVADLTLIEDKLKAMLAEAQAVAQMSTALFNNLHANAGAQGSDSVSTSL
ncbi:MAG TPA: hypothetical protein PK782_14360 [Nitrospira sp.]|nr:hypothetical protein [Rhodocyclaceae bacterium]HND03257.1 hypothetical protein [Nitrospira sp.]HNG03885.1 hypothetical protein [Nitrospira sp.]